MMKMYDLSLQNLKTLSLKGIVKNYDEIIQESENEKYSYVAFLNRLLESEIEYRVEKRFLRNLAGAHFPVTKDIESFEFGKVKGITKMETAQLLEFKWIDNHQNVLFFGPPGLGKSHLVVGIGMKAVERGYVVSFERMTNLIKLLKTGEIQRSAVFRLNKILKSHLVIIDEIGYTPIEKKEANLFFNLVSELYEKASVMLTSNKSFSEWAEMMGDPIMTTALLDRLLHHSKIFNLSGDSYRIQNFKKEVQ